MKLYGWFIIIIALGLAVFNLFQLDFNNPMAGNSKVALIGIVTSFCAIVLTLIYMKSKKIANHLEENNNTEAATKTEQKED